MTIGITGLGAYLPDRILSNADIEVGTGFDRSTKGGRSLDEWARRHHGGIERRRAASGQATSDLATAAGRAALADAGLAPGDVDLLVLATVTSDFRLPPTAAVVQANLELDVKFLQLDSACTGFIDTVLTAAGLLSARLYRRALVVCADSCGPWLDPSDWLTQTVFGDGAAAAVLDRYPDGYGFTHMCSMSEGNLGHYVRITAGGSRCATADRSGADPRFLRTDFGDVHRWGVPRMIGAARRVLKEAGLDVDDVTWLVPHQASTRIVREAAAELGLPAERVIMTYPRYGNTVGSSLPIALHHAYREGRFRDGDILLLTSVGAGMAWGSAIYRWRGPSVGRRSLD